MSSSEAPRCRHVKVNGTQCGSPAVRSKSFCYYHQQHRPILAECYSDGEYSTGEILLPVFEDAHSVQSVIRKVVQMVLQKRIERKTASLLLSPPDRLFQSEAHGTRKAATRAGCDRCRTALEIRTSHRRPRINRRRSKRSFSARPIGQRSSRQCATAQA